MPKLSREEIEYVLQLGAETVKTHHLLEQLLRENAMFSEVIVSELAIFGCFMTIQKPFRKSNSIGAEELNEDKACIRNDNAAENMDILRKWALAVLAKTKVKPEQTIRSLMRKNAMSFKYLVSSVKKILHA